MKKTSKAQLQLVLKMRKLRKILLQPRRVPSKPLKNHIDSEKLRLRPRKYLLRKQLVKEELKLPPGNSNSIKRKLLLKKPAKD